MRPREQGHKSKEFRTYEEFLLSFHPHRPEQLIADDVAMANPGKVLAKRAIVDLRMSIIERVQKLK